MFYSKNLLLYPIKKVKCDLRSKYEAGKFFLLPFILKRKYTVISLAFIKQCQVACLRFIETEADSESTAVLKGK